MFISITYIEINTINATNIYVVDVCTKRKFYRKKHLIELIEMQLRKKLKLNSTKNKILKIRNLKRKINKNMKYMNKNIRNS